MHQSSRVPRPWVLKPENRVPIQLQILGFPADRHLASPITLYFLHVNSVLPALHHPGFEDRLKLQPHMIDPAFQTLLLLVCALGSLYLPATDISRRDRETLAWK
ncbi:hypothetical protein K438DRAFT_1835994 [Mycena galopus ATCC 62051]|nr:hypothetical protein K438DRAFT_1835994 [Mycena galopus ATCC 62051]